jgi:drug/metabolite transporter (DMT)-like permease
MIAPLWTLFTVLAIFSQTVRTAGQKYLSLTLDAVTVTFSRFLFGLPFVLAYFFFLRSGAEVLPRPGLIFWICCAFAAGLQIAATILMVRLFHLRNFAVGMTYIRTEAFLTAFVGVLFFGELLSFKAWIAISVSVCGVLVMNRAKSAPSGAGLFSWVASPSAIIGLSSGLLFAITSLLIRKAGLSLELDNLVLSGATTLVAVVSIQTLSMGLWIAIRNRGTYAALFSRAKLCTFVGLTSATGSIGWFTAMTLERASIVKAVGQIELVLALLVSVFLFKEKIKPFEFFGVVLMIIGIVALLVS